MESLPPGPAYERAGEPAGPASAPSVGGDRMAPRDLQGEKSRQSVRENSCVESAGDSEKVAEAVNTQPPGQVNAVIPGEDSRGRFEVGVDTAEDEDGNEANASSSETLVGEEPEDSDIRYYIPHMNMARDLGSNFQVFKDQQKSPAVAITFGRASMDRLDVDRSMPTSTSIPVNPNNFRDREGQRRVDSSVEPNSLCYKEGSENSFNEFVESRVYSYLQDNKDFPCDFNLPGNPNLKQQSHNMAKINSDLIPSVSQEKVKPPDGPQEGPSCRPKERNKIKNQLKKSWSTQDSLEPPSSPERRASSSDLYSYVKGDFHKPKSIEGSSSQGDYLNDTSYDNDSDPLLPSSSFYRGIRPGSSFPCLDMNGRNIAEQINLTFKSKYNYDGDLKLPLNIRPPPALPCGYTTEQPYLSYPSSPRAQQRRYAQGIRNHSPRSRRVSKPLSSTDVNKIYSSIKENSKKMHRQLSVSDSVEDCTGVTNYTDKAFNEEMSSTGEYPKNVENFTYDNLDMRMEMPSTSMSGTDDRCPTTAGHPDQARGRHSFPEEAVRYPTMTKAEPMANISRVSSRSQNDINPCTFSKPFNNVTDPPSVLPRQEGYSNNKEHYPPQSYSDYMFYSENPPVDLPGAANYPDCSQDRPQNPAFPSRNLPPKPPNSLSLHQNKSSLNSSPVQSRDCVRSGTQSPIRSSELHSPIMPEIFHPPPCVPCRPPRSRSPYCSLNLPEGSQPEFPDSRSFPDNFLVGPPSPQPPPSNFMFGPASSLDLPDNPSIGPPSPSTTQRTFSYPAPGSKFPPGSLPLGSPNSSTQYGIQQSGPSSPREPLGNHPSFGELQPRDPNVPRKSSGSLEPPEPHQDLLKPPDAVPVRRASIVTCDTMQASLDPHPNPVKIIVLGDNGVGKTAVIVRLVTGRFIGDYDPALAAVYSYRLPQQGYSDLQLQLMDTASRGACQLEGSQLQWADAALVVFSVTSNSSLGVAEAILARLRGVEGVDEGTSEGVDERTSEGVDKRASEGVDEGANGEPTIEPNKDASEETGMEHHKDSREDPTEEPDREPHRKSNREITNVPVKEFTENNMEETNDDDSCSESGKSIPSQRAHQPNEQASNSQRNDSYSQVGRGNGGNFEGLCSATTAVLKQGGAEPLSEIQDSREGEIDFIKETAGSKEIKETILRISETGGLWGGRDSSELVPQADRDLTQQDEELISGSVQDVQSLKHGAVNAVNREVQIGPEDREEKQTAEFKILENRIGRIPVMGDDCGSSIDSNDDLQVMETNLTKTQRLKTADGCERVNYTLGLTTESHTDENDDCSLYRRLADSEPKLQGSSDCGTVQEASVLGAQAADDHSTTVAGAVTGAESDSPLIKQTEVEGVNSGRVTATVVGAKSCVSNTPRSSSNQLQLQPLRGDEESNQSQPQPVAESNQSQPQTVVESNQSQPQPVAENNQSQPQPVAENNQSQPQPVAENNQSQAQLVAENNQSQPQPVAENNQSQTQPVAENNQSQPQPVAENNQSQPQTVAENNQSQPQPVAENNQSQPQPILVNIEDNQIETYPEPDGTTINESGVHNDQSEADEDSRITDENRGLPDENQGIPDETQGISDETRGIPDETQGSSLPKTGDKGSTQSLAAAPCKPPAARLVKPTLLLGNKTDLEHRREVPPGVARAVAARYHCLYCEVAASAPWDEVSRPFMDLYSQVLDRRSGGLAEPAGGPVGSGGGPVGPGGGQAEPGGEAVEPAGGPVGPGGGPAVLGGGSMEPGGETMEPGGGPVGPGGGPAVPGGGPTVLGGGPVGPSGRPVMPGGGSVEPGGGPVGPGGGPAGPGGGSAEPGDETMEPGGGPVGPVGGPVGPGGGPAVPGGARSGH